MEKQQLRTDVSPRNAMTWAIVILLCGGLLACSPRDSDETSSGGNGAEALPDTEANIQQDALARKFPTWDEVELNWPSFRGPGAYGKAHFDNAPTEWEAKTGKGILWKTPLERPGTNSPVVWNDRIFLSSADENVREIYCYDTETGKLVWKRALEKFPGSPTEDPAPTSETGYDASTMVVHGEQVFAIFANGDLASYDFEGNMVWGKAMGLPDNHYGHSSSLIAYQNLVYVQFDQAEDSKLFALDVATGNEVWAAERDVISWASPIIAHTPVGPQLILCTDPTVDAYDPLTGKLLWSQECLMGEVAPSATYSNGVVFAAMEYALASAIKIGGSPKNVQSEIVWEWDEILPEVSSPVGDGERFYIATSFGDLVCLDAKTGKELWVEEVSYGFYSSPVLVGDRIYVLDMEGAMYIVRASSEYELIATSELGEQTLATPAFLDGRIYIRTAENLYAIQ